MYSMHQFEPLNPKPIHQRMYTTGRVALEDRTPPATRPKMDKVLQSVSNALNLIWDYFAKAPTNIMTNLNNPLSVTVVQNEGIISNEFFKGLTRRKDEDDSYGLEQSRRHSSLKHLQAGLLDDKGYVYEPLCHGINEFEIIESFERFDLSNSKDSKMAEFNSLVPYYNSVNDNLTSTHPSNQESEKNGLIEKKLTKKYKDPDNLAKNCLARPFVKFSALCLALNPRTSLSCLYPSLLRRPSDKPDQVLGKELVQPDAMARKNFLLDRRTTAVKSKVQGSQKPNAQCPQRVKCQPKAKRDFRVMIREELQDWREYNVGDWLSWEHEDEQEPHLIDISDPLVLKGVLDGVLCDLQEELLARQYPEGGFGFGAVLEEEEQSEFRPRLLSESSVDSEDSYCIVFETEPGPGLRNEEECEDWLSSDEEEDESELETPTPKVRFDPMPRVHTMVKWDYAYRAARRGPWEEMARDRERFKGRINSIERVLRPILSAQHRTRVWLDRFKE